MATEHTSTVDGQSALWIALGCLCIVAGVGSVTESLAASLVAVGLGNLLLARVWIPALQHRHAAATRRLS